MNGVVRNRGLSEKNLKHIFLGEIKNGDLQGYHHEGEDYGDTIAEVVNVDNGEIFVHPICENKGKGIYEARIRDKKTLRMKSAYGGKSTFFKKSWSRQKVVDCIDRADANQPLINQYPKKNIAFDPQEGIVIVKVGQSAYPILKY